MAELKQKKNCNLLYNLYQEEKKGCNNISCMRTDWNHMIPSLLLPFPQEMTIPFHCKRHQTRAWHMLPHAPAEATLNYQSDCTAAETCQQMTTWINDTWKAICTPCKSAAPAGHEANITPLWWALCLKNYNPAQDSHLWPGFLCCSELTLPLPPPPPGWRPSVEPTDGPGRLRQV